MRKVWRSRRLRFLEHVEKPTSHGKFLAAYMHHWAKIKIVFRFFSLAGCEGAPAGVEPLSGLWSNRTWGELTSTSCRGRR